MVPPGVHVVYKFVFLKFEALTVYIVNLHKKTFRSRQVT